MSPLPIGIPSARQGCMVDPEVDSGFVLDAHGDIHITRSPFFDVGFDFDDIVEDYLNRILPHLVGILDDQFSDYEWTINDHPPASPTPSSSPATSPLGITCVIVVSLSLLTILFR
ncbi:hypothetical protein MA16_Dca029107 [Dendrobium catenatum]|uniref:Uncharacterized protein n=1 Tax=Dendrobium catenatum TaxID=906689 RepID=A0A2I0V6K3_9ASPA|nr:hypothetical protein MA16_Dca029107 [Dendrobium catenatum]